jgi:hypothetical protein
MDGILGEVAEVLLELHKEAFAIGSIDDYIPDMVSM